MKKDGKIIFYMCNEYSANREYYFVASCFFFLSRKHKTALHILEFLFKSRILGAMPFIGRRDRTILHIYDKCVC